MRFYLRLSCIITLTILCSLKIVLSTVVHSRDVNLFLNIIEIIIFKKGNTNTNLHQSHKKQDQNVKSFNFICRCRKISRLARKNYDPP